MPNFQQLNFTFTAENSNFPREKDGRRQIVNKSKEKNSEKQRPKIKVLNNSK